VVQRLIPAQSLGILVGSTGAYKTFVTIDIACSSATQTNFGEELTQGGFSVLVSGEGGTAIARRVKAWELKNKCEVKDGLLRIDQALNPLDHADYRLLLSAIKSHESRVGKPASLIIFDTLSQCSSGLDENSAGAMSLFLKACNALSRETGATVLLIHHNGKNSGYRGSGALECNVDFMLTLEKSKTDLSTQLEIKKMKDGDTDLVYQIELDLIDLEQKDQFGCKVTSLAVGKLTKKTVTLEKPRAIIDDDRIIIMKLIEEFCSLNKKTSMLYKDARQLFIESLVAKGTNVGTAGNRFTRAIKAALSDNSLSRCDNELSLSAEIHGAPPEQLSFQF
jgi:hypothetical protein